MVVGSNPTGPTSLTANIAVERCSFPAYPVCFVGQRVYATGVDPSIIKVEQGAYCNCQIDGVVLPAGGVKRLHIFGRNAWRIVIDLVDKSEQSLMLFIELGVLQIPQDTPNQLFVAQ